MDYNKEFYELVKDRWEEQVARFKAIYKKEVVDRKRLTRRGNIVQEVMYYISNDFFNEYNPKFNTYFEQGNLMSCWAIYVGFKKRLDGYKKVVKSYQ